MAIRFPHEALVDDAREWVSDCVTIPDGATTREVFAFIARNYEGGIDDYCRTTYGTRFWADARQEIRSTWNI